MYGPVRTVVWQGSAGDRRPYADQTRWLLESTTARRAALIPVCRGPENTKAGGVAGLAALLSLPQLPVLAGRVRAESQAGIDGEKRRP